MRPIKRIWLCDKAPSHTSKDNSEDESPGQNKGRHRNKGQPSGRDADRRSRKRRCELRRAKETVLEKLFVHCRSKIGIRELRIGRDNTKFEERGTSGLEDHDHGWVKQLKLRK